MREDSADGKSRLVLGSESWMLEVGIGKVAITAYRVGITRGDRYVKVMGSDNSGRTLLRDSLIRRVRLVERVGVVV
jgi:hypothetical protein